MNRTFLAVGALVAIGCGTSIKYMPLNTAPRSMTARDPSSVEVFTSSKPEKPFVEVAMIEAQQASAYSVDDQTVVIAKLRDEASKRGCDAIIVGANDAMTMSGSMHGGYGSMSGETLRGYRGTCIVYK